MAQILRLTRKNPRIKKWEHFKLKLRIWLFRISILLNLICIFLLDENKTLTNNVIQVITPIWEIIKLKLPL